MSTTTSSEATAPTLTGIHHLGVTVRDIEASEAWYSRVFGLVRAFVEPHHHGDGYAVVLTQPGSGLLLGLDHHPDADRACFEARRTGLDHLAFGVPSRAELEAWTARLDTLRVAHDPVTETTEPAPLALVTFRDPDEIALELIWYGG